MEKMWALNILQIVTGNTKNESRRKFPAAKHYVWYPEPVQGERISPDTCAGGIGYDLAIFRNLIPYS